MIKAGLVSNRGQVLAGLVAGYFIQASYRNDRLDKLLGADDRDSWRSWIRLAIKETGQAINGLDWFGGSGHQILTAVLIGLAVILLIFVLRLFSAAWFVLKFYDYQLVRRGARLSDPMRALHKVSASVPGDRIQVISVHRTLLARWFGLAAIRVEASGGSGKEDEDASTTVARQWFVPVMSAEELPRVLQTLQPQLTADTQSLNWRPLAPRAYQRMIRMPLLFFAVVWLVSVAIGSLLDWSYAFVPLVVSIVGA